MLQDEDNFRFDKHQEKYLLNGTGWWSIIEAIIMIYVGVVLYGIEELPRAAVQYFAVVLLVVGIGTIIILAITKLKLELRYFKNKIKNNKNDRI